MEGGSKGGGEVRRISVVYFLSRKGKVEHPHLIRVHHFHSKGVHLRDMKRWLSELRGKDMPESFAWSYKRRYKTGYVWQDLADDDDLITPVSDNEYVLKGSELLSKIDHRLPFGELSSGDRLHARVEPEAKESPSPKTPCETLQVEPADDTISAEPPPRIDDQESPPLPTPPHPALLSEDSVKSRAVLKIDMSKQEKRKKREEGRKQQNGKCDSNRSSSGRRATRAFRNLLGCRPTEIKDSVLFSVGQQHERDGNISRDLSVGEIRKQRSFSSSRSNQHHNSNNARKSWSGGGRSSKKNGEKPVPAAYKPTAEPNCSQCGKTFKPERLHSHMKSCKAFRARISTGNEEAATKH